MLKYYTIIYLVFASIAGMAQYNIKGQLKDEKNENLPFATVLLLNAKDSSLAKAAIADQEGRFLIEQMKPNTYLLKATSVGYADAFTKVFELNSDLNLPDIKLSVASNNLSEVSVVAKKPFIEQQIDKTVLNVENSITGSGNTALELLEKAPSLTIDRQNDQIKIKNKTGVIVMIDGRKNYLSNEALMQYLTNLSSENIASIEIITNPSSKYDASGNSGIINIKLKKNTQFGTNGTLSLGLGNVFLPNSTPDLVRTTSGLTLNHRTARWNIYGNANGTRYSYFNDNQINRHTFYDGQTINFESYSKRAGKGFNTTGKLGADYYLSKKTTLGLMVDVNNSDGKMNSDGNTNLFDVETNSKTSLKSSSLEKNYSTNLSSNFNLKHSFNDKGKEITFDADHSVFWNNAVQDFRNQYYKANGTNDYLLLQKQKAPSNINILAFKTDFTLPIYDKTKWEFGAKSSFVKTDNDFLFQSKVDSVWKVDLGKTNHFIYTENVNAAYVNFAHSWKKISISSGLRVEQTHSVGNSITLDKKVDRNYLSWFPTLFFSQQLAKDHALKYSYSRRIDRPNYQQLNPFIFFIDPYTYSEGNPFLKPQFTDNIELAYTYKSSATLSFGYAKTHDNMFQVLFQNDSTRSTYQTTVNLKQTDNYSASLSFPLTITKYWSMQNNFNLYRQSFSDPNLSGAGLSAHVWAHDFYVANTFTLKKQWAAELNMWYNSKNLYGIVRSLKPQYAVNFGLQKSFWNKKAKLKLNVNDMFLTSFFKAEVKYQNINLDLTNRWSSRRVMLTFSYNFGNQNIKSTSKSTAADDLKNRVNRSQN